MARTFRKTYTALGFSKGYNALLWFHLAGAMFGFCLARTPYLAVDTHFRKNAAPGNGSTSASLFTAPASFSTSPSSSLRVSWQLCSSRLC